MKYYAIKRPDGSWVMRSAATTKFGAWDNADEWEDERLMGVPEDTWEDRAKAAGYRCVEVDGFREVEK